MSQGSSKQVRRAACWAVEQLERRMLLSVKGGPQWEEQGPVPAVGETGSTIPEVIGTPGVGANPVAGAIQAIATPPGAPNVIYVAAVNGGVWRTSTGTADVPVWEPLTDNERSLSMGALAISPFFKNGTRIPATRAANDPIDVGQLVVYAGFGVFTNGGFEHVSMGGPRRGMLKSTDGGTTWTPFHLKKFEGLDIRSIVPSQSDPNTVFVAAHSRPNSPSTRAGIWRIVGSQEPELVLPGEVSNLVTIPGDGQRYYAGMERDGVFRSTAGGTKGTWAEISNGFDVLRTNNFDDDKDSGKTADNVEESLANVGRVHVASAANNVVYAALISDFTDSLMGIFRWNEATSTWTHIPGQPDLHPGGQGDENFAMAVDPNHPHVVYAAGDRNIARRGGAVWQVDTTKTPAWASVVFAGASGGPGGVFTASHPDSRDMVFNADGALLQADDGGIYRLNNPSTSASRFWDSRNGNLRTGELYSVAFDSLTNSLFAGQQDVGVVEQPRNGGDQWNSITAGDGIYVGVHNKEGSNITTRYSSRQNLQFFKKRVVGADGKLVGAEVTLNPVVEDAGGRTLLGTGVQNGRFDETVWFATPFVVNRFDANRLLIGTKYLYESVNGGTTVRSLGGLTPAKNEPDTQIGEITAMAYGGMDGTTERPEVAYVAVGRDLWVRHAGVTGGLIDFTSTTGYYDRKGGNIRDIALDPTDWRKGYLVDDRGAVWAFQNAGAAKEDFKLIVGNLGSYTNSLRSVEVIPTPGNAKTPAGHILAVGGLKGVFLTLDPRPGGANKWFEVGGRKMPNAALVTDVRYEKSRGDDVLYCSTFGRGAWKITNFLSKLFPPTTAAASVPAGLGLMAAIELDPDTVDEPGLLQITGDDGASPDDTIRLVLDPTNPDILNVFVNNASGKPDFSIDAAAVLKLDVTGGDGNDTLLIDHSNGLVSFPDGIVFDDTGPGTNTRQDVNLTSIEGGVAATIRAGLQGLADWGKRLAEFGQLAQDLPGLGRSIADTLSVGDGSDPLKGLLQQGLVDRVNQFFVGDLTPTVQELADLLKRLNTPLGNVHFGIEPGSVTAGIFTAAGGGQELRVDIVLNLAGFEAAIPIDFDAGFEALGLTARGDGAVNLGTNVTLDFSFGVDLAPGLSDADAFFVRVNDVSASVHAAAGRFHREFYDGEFAAKPGKDPGIVSGPGMNFDLNVGFLQAAVRNGVLVLDASLALEFDNPDDDPNGNITLAELTGTSVDGLVDIELDGSLQADLPVKVSLAGLPAASPRILITSNDLFGGAPQVSVENFESLLDFRNISTENVFQLLSQLVGALNTFRQSDVFETSIPFTGATLGDALDFATALDQKVIQPLTAAGGGAGFAGAQQLAEMLAAALGLDPAVIDAKYNPATHEVTYRVKLSAAMAPRNFPLSFSSDLGPLGGVSTSSQVTLNGNLLADFTFGINLSPGPLTPSGRFFVQGGTLNGNLALNAADIDASARFGFVQVGTSDGSGAINGTVALSLKNPTSTGTRLTLAELAEAASGDALALLAGGAPKLAGTASLKLDKLAITPGVTGLTPPAGSHVSVSVADLLNPTNAAVEVVGFDGLKNLRDLSFDDVIAALDDVVAYLAKLETFGFLNRKLPLVDRSVSDLIDWAQGFTAKLDALRANPTQSLQAVEQAIEQRFGIAPSLVSLSIDGAALKTHLEFGHRFVGDLPFNFDLGALGSLPAGLSGILNLSGSGQVHVNAGLGLKLNLGLDLSNPQTPVPFIYDSTATTVDARVSAQGLTFTLAIVGLGAKITNGSVNLHKMGDANAPATFTATLLAPAGDTDGRHYFSQLATLTAADVGLSLNGAVDVDLPIEFPIGSLLVPPLHITIADLQGLFAGTGGGVAVTPPDLASKLNGLNLSGDLSALLAGLDQLLGLLHAGMNSGAFAGKIPLIGDKLGQGATAIQKFREEVIGRLTPYFANPGQNTLTNVQNALFTEMKGMGVLRDLDGSGVVDVNDVAIVLDNASAPTDVRFDFHLVWQAPLVTLPAGFDVGIPALNLKVAGDVQIKSGIDVKFGVGVSKTAGVYLYVANPDELKVNVDVTIPGLSAHGKLGFVEVDVKDDAGSPSKFGGTFAVDLVSADNRLTAAELAGAALNARLDAQAKADVNLKLEVRYQNDAEARFPRVLADLNIDWAFGNAATSGPASYGSAPQVAFNNVGLKLGSFLDHFARPVLNTVNDALAPLQPVIDILETEVPMLADVDDVRDFFDRNNDDLVTVGEVIQTLDDSAVLDLIQGVAALRNLLSKTQGVGDTLINLGSFNLFNQDLRNLTSLANASPTASAPANTAQQLRNHNAALATALENPALGSAANAGKGKLSFPILQNPASAFQLLMGKDVDLFEWDMPAFGVNLRIDESFHVIGPIDVHFGGSLSVAADLAFGYDTSGLRAVAGGAPLSKAFDGFFLRDIPAGATTDPAEITARGEIKIGAGLDLLVVSGELSGALRGDLKVNLADPDNSDGQGKVRFAELRQQLAKGLFCVFDITGSVTAALVGSVSVGVWPLEKSWSADFVEIQLLDFSSSCDDTPPDQPAEPILASVHGGILRLHMGPFAADRVNGDLTDGDESFTVRPDPAVPGNLLVEAFGYVQSYAGAGSIFASGGLGNDTITVATSVTVPAELWGDFTLPELVGQFGNDVLSGGGGNDRLFGGAGKDHLSGNGGNDFIGGDADNDASHFGNDVIYGGAGNDTLAGERGDDLLDGGTGDDSLSAGPGADKAYGGFGADAISGGAGNDRLYGDNDTFIKLPKVFQSPGADTIHGDDGDDLIQGGGAGDSLFGDAGNDKVAGEAGNDTASGGTGDDQLSGGTGDDSLTGDDGKDTVAGDAGLDNLHGNAGDDTVSGGDDNDAVFGDGDNDVLSGDGGNDSVSGGDGNDSADGNGGDDTVKGDAGDDTVRGGDGADSVLGGTGNDSAFGDAGDDRLEGEAGDDRMEGGVGHDLMLGGDGLDTMLGQEGDDAMQGGAGGDSMFGNAGDDDMVGGADGDVMDGGIGHDVMLGDDGTITRSGAVLNTDGSTRTAGRDVTLSVGAGGADVLTGGDGHDSMYGQGGDDHMSGGEGDDDAVGGLGSDTMGGDGGYDVLVGDRGTILTPRDVTPPAIPESGAIRRAVTLESSDADGGDTIGGGLGDDTIFGQGGGDYLSGDGGDDVIEGNQGNDTLGGGDGDDDLVGGSSVAGAADGADLITGDAGHDVIAGDNAFIHRITLPGNVYARFLAGLPAGAGLGLENDAIRRRVDLLDLDTIGGGDTTRGGAGDDSVYGGLGDDSIHGDDGHDDLIGHLGADAIDGGAGDDGIVGDKGTIVPDLLDGTGQLFISSQAHKVSATIDAAGTRKRWVTLVDPTLGGADVITGGEGSDSVHGGAGGDRIFGDAGVGGTAAGGNDALFGNDGDDVIQGGGGNDHLFGGGGNDTLDGNAGAEISYGGAGADTLIADSSLDRLIDWFGNFNDFEVVGPGNGGPVIIRSPAPAMIQFLRWLAAGDGATNVDEELAIVTPPSPSNSGS